MNIDVSDEIKSKWCNYEFLGKSFTLKDGRKYIRAYSKCFDTIHYYCFDTDFMWWDKEDILSKQ